MGEGDQEGPTEQHRLELLGHEVLRPLVSRAMARVHPGPACSVGNGG